MANSRPNIIVIMTDQQRADLARREGYPLDTTPFQDRLAARGVWFNRAYTANPVCMCARISMLTGRFPSAHGVRTNYNEADLFTSTDLFRHFRELGYRTSLCGKNHTHLRSKDVDYWFEAHHSGAQDVHENPQHEAFDKYLGQMHMHLSLPVNPFPIECQLPYRIVSKAQRWIETPSDKPFLLWLSFPEPHNPFQAPEPYYSLFPPESLPPLRSSAADLPIKGFPYLWCRQSFEKAFPGFPQTINRARANYHGMLRLIDDQVQRLFQFCDQRGLLENTIVVFLSDHGDFVGEYGLLRKGPELPELLTRIPLLFTGPGISPLAGPHAAHVSITDLFPTLCQAAGSPIPEGVQGRSLWPLLTGQPYAQEEFASIYAEHGFGGLPYDGTESLDPAKDGLTASPGKQEWGSYDCLNSWTQSGTLRMVRKGDWKLVLNNLKRGQLYNLASDPVELVNLYNHPTPEAQEAQHALMAELALWMLRTVDPLPLTRPNHLGRRYIPKWS